MSFKQRYDSGEMSCIDAIRAAMTEEEFRGFVKGNALKYVWRERHKGGDEDLYKAEDYLHYLRTGKWADEDRAQDRAEAVQHGRIIEALAGDGR